jgi:Protein of unknown function (DUF3987)
MSRNYTDWLAAFMDYASIGEAPDRMYFWTGVSTIAGALRRKVWIDQGLFSWYPNFYIVLVAPPGIVSKSTTAGIGMNLLRQVPGIKFGPDIVTWPALIEAFAESQEGFELEGAMHVMSAITLESSEFGNLVDPSDEKMVDLLVALWDGKPGAFSKRTKSSGNDSVENPWINMIGCTTPSWIAGNFPEYMIGGGFTSRCIFVYADKKAKFVAYPGQQIGRKDLKEKERKLIEDLTHISTLAGEYILSPEAIEWGTAWYKQHFTVRNIKLDDERFGGYIARKQTMLHKLAMILAAASTDTLIITKEHLEVAELMITDLETDMQFVFSKIGKSESALYTERLIWFVQQKKEVPFHEAYRYVHSYFPSMRDFDDILAGCVKAGFLRLVQENGVVKLVSVGGTA